MAVGYASFAAPIPSSVQSLGLGVTSQPATTGAVTPTVVTAPPANAQAVASPNAQVATGYTASPLPTVPAANIATSYQQAATGVVGGGVIAQTYGAGGSAMNRILETVSNGQKRLQAQMDAEVTASGKELDAMTAQKYTRQFANFELVMQCIAKMQESEENCVRAFLR